MKKKFAGLVILIFLLSGCSPRQQTQKPLHIVTQIRATYPENEKIFNTPAAMDPILVSLRLLEQEKSEHNLPLDTFGPTLKITLRYWDGTEKRYRLQSDRYLCSDKYGWRPVSQTNAQRLREYVELFVPEGF